MNINIYLWVATIFLSIWSVAWDKKDAFNLLVKFSFSGLAIWGWYIIFHLK